MTVSFADYAAGAKERQDASETILRNAQELCEALKENYKSVAIRGHEFFIQKSENIEYHQKVIEDLKSGKSPVNFMIQSGRKYHKIVFVDGGGVKSAHAFIDRKTGGLLKTKSWNSPVQGERYNLLNSDDFDWLMKNADWSAGYTYKR